MRHFVTYLVRLKSRTPAQLDENPIQWYETVWLSPVAYAAARHGAAMGLPVGVEKVCLYAAGYILD